jgi:hypothetical protein
MIQEILWYMRYYDTGDTMIQLVVPIRISLIEGCC